MWNITIDGTIEGFFKMPNSLTGGWFWSMVLFSMAVVTFIIARQKTSADRAFAITGFGSWIFGTFMFFLGWINWMVYAASIFLMIGGIVSMMIRQEPEI